MVYYGWIESLINVNHLYHFFTIYHIVMKYLWIHHYNYKANTFDEWWITLFIHCNANTLWTFDLLTLYYRFLIILEAIL